MRLQSDVAGAGITWKASSVSSGSCWLSVGIPTGVPSLWPGCPLTLVAGFQEQASQEHQVETLLPFMN